MEDKELSFIRHSAFIIHHFSSGHSMSETDTALPIRIAIVEDNPGDVYILRKALREIGLRFTVDYLEDGEAAIDFFLRQGKYSAAQRPDVVILDLNLPRITGDEILRRVRIHPDLRNLSVIVLTTSDTAEDRQKMAALGVAYYFVKSGDLSAYLAVGRVIQEMTTAEC
jgi:CheY-like chemotaxis protein